MNIIENLKTIYILVSVQKKFSGIDILQPSKNDAQGSNFEVWQKIILKGLTFQPLI